MQWELKPFNLHLQWDWLKDVHKVGISMVQLFDGAKKERANVLDSDLTTNKTNYKP